MKTLKRGFTLIELLGVCPDTSSDLEIIEPMR